MVHRQQSALATSRAGSFAGASFPEHVEETRGADAPNTHRPRHIPGDQSFDEIELAVANGCHGPADLLDRVRVSRVLHDAELERPWMVCDRPVIQVHAEEECVGASKVHILGIGGMTTDRLSRDAPAVRVHAMPRSSSERSLWLSRLGVVQAS